MSSGAATRPTLTPEQRARNLARGVAKRIANEIAPPGLGAWPPAWSIVAGPTDAFLDALNLWESEGAPVPVPPYVRRAGDAALEAWREAARQWAAAGRPGAPHAVTSDQGGER